MSALNSWAKHHTLDIHDITTQIVHQQAISHKINAIGVDSFSHGAFRSSFPLPVLEWHFSSIINFKTHFWVAWLAKKQDLCNYAIFGERIDKSKKCANC